MLPGRGSTIGSKIPISLLLDACDCVTTITTIVALLRDICILVRLLL
jgi:hypothetical protein